MQLTSFFRVCPRLIILEPCSTQVPHSVADEDWYTTDWYIGASVSVDLAACILRVAQEK